MLRGNLASRPFYNDRLASVIIGLIGLGVIALAGFNVWQLVTLSRERAAVRTTLDGNLGEVGRIQQAAADMRRTIDRPTLARLASSAREANGLIDRRTFSWTTLFGLLEKTLPIDVRLVAVTPRVERNVFLVSMSVVARDFQHIDAFIDALQKTGAFYDVAPTEQQRNDDGSYGAIVEAGYLAPVLVSEKATEVAAPAAPPARGGAQ